MSTGLNLKEKSLEIFDDDRFVVANSKVNSGIRSVTFSKYSETSVTETAEFSNRRY